MFVSHWLRKLASTPRHSLFSPRGSVLESVEEEMKAAGAAGEGGTDPKSEGEL